jgi:hypothetical protein
MITYVKWITATQVLEEHYVYVVTVKNLPSAFYIGQSRGHQACTRLVYVMCDRFLIKSFLVRQIDNSQKRIVVILLMLSVNNMPRQFLSVSSIHTVRLVEHQSETQIMIFSFLCTRTYPYQVVYLVRIPVPGTRSLTVLY